VSSNKEIQLCWVKTGVGKTTIIEGVALKIANGDVHIFLVVRSING
jgi:ATP-dependent Clp protease ATP-binding subunit ClpA